MGIGGGNRPLQHSWMSFIDGENLTIRAQELGKRKNLPISEGKHHKPDCFIWIPNYHGQQILGTPGLPQLQPFATRAYYYTSLASDYPTLDQVRDSLRNLNFSPQVFKKARRELKAKGVDIALTKDMLSHAFLGNYETAGLVAGDGDYVPLVQEVQRLGKRVVVWFFQDCTSPELIRTADFFADITNAFEQNWRMIPPA